MSNLQHLALSGCCAAFLLLTVGCSGGGAGGGDGPVAAPVTTAVAPPTSTDLNPPLLTNALPAAFPFDRPALSTLRVSPKKVFAHYLPSFPRSIDNLNPTVDYYTREYLDPAGEGGKHAGNGGFIRERPSSRSVISAADWAVLDCRAEVQRGADMGLDGFAYDILSTDTTYRARLSYMMNAAVSTDAGFKILLMPDMTSEFGTAPGNLKPYLKELATGPNNSSLYRLSDGRLVISPFIAHAQTAAWWKTNVLDPLAADGIPVAFVPLFLDWKSHAAEFKNISYGMSDWGAREPANASNMQAWKADSVPFTSVWMSPVGFSDVRPNAFSFVETEASKGCRNAWTSAIDGGANWVQIVSWNDFSEASEIQPSSGIQSNAYKLNAYYLSWFKTGSAPAIVREQLHYLHRTHPVGAAPNLNKQTRAFKLAYGATNVDVIELIGFLTAPGTLSITVDGVTTSRAVGAGMQVITAPLRLGRPEFSLTRNGTTVLQTISQWLITDNITYQDLLYRGADTTIPTAVGCR